MAKKRIPVDEFLPLYLEAYEHGLTREEFAEQVGLKPLTVYQRIYEMRDLDPSIPLLKTAGKTPAGEKVKAIMAEYHKRNKTAAKPKATKEVVEEEEMEESDPLADILG